MSLVGQKIPSVSELVSFMQATRQKYKIFDATIQILATKPAGSNSQRQEVYKYQVIWRTDGQRYYCKIEGLDYDPKGQASKISRTYLFAPEQSRRLEIRKEKQPRGYITKGWPWKWKDPLAYGFTPYEALWECFCPFPLEEADLHVSTVDIDKASGNFVLILKLGSVDKGPLIRLYIDPDKEYIPVKKQLIKMPDDLLVIDYECGSIHKDTSSLWVPFEYNTVNNDGFTIICKVERISVNEPLAEASFDLIFPEGTIIQDDAQ